MLAPPWGETEPGKGGKSCVGRRESPEMETHASPSSTLASARYKDERLKCYFTFNHLHDNQPNYDNLT